MIKRLFISLFLMSLLLPAGAVEISTQDARAGKVAKVFRERFVEAFGDAPCCVQSISLVLDDSCDLGEGYSVTCADDGRLFIKASRVRGLYYGVGYLLRKAVKDGENVVLPVRDTVCRPEKKYRGVEIQPNPVFRDKLSPVALDQYEKYLQDMLFFGANCIEVLKNIPRKYVDIALGYDYEISVVQYYKEAPVPVKNYFDKFARIDHWCIKSGDPGEMEPEEFMYYAAGEAKALKAQYPEIKIWIAPQRYAKAPTSYFELLYKAINESAWVDGVCYGPWCKSSLAELRDKIDPQKELRHFPDITHIYSCQYLVEELKLDMAQALGRICVNPTPRHIARIAKETQPYVEGTVAYCEGQNDDVNRMVSFSLDWAPEQSLDEILADYVRLFFHEYSTDKVVQALYGLEENMKGDILENKSIPRTLEAWRVLEQRHFLGSNTRLAMCVLRAYYDSYIQEKVRIQRQEEASCLALLRFSLSDETLAKALSFVSSPIVPGALYEHTKSLIKLVYSSSNLWTSQYQPCVLAGQIDGFFNDAPYLRSCIETLQKMPLGKRQSAFHAMCPSHEDDILYINCGQTDADFEGVDAVTYGWKMSRFVVAPVDFAGKSAPRSSLSQVCAYYDRPLTLVISSLNPDNYTLTVTYSGELYRNDNFVSFSVSGAKMHGYIHPDKVCYTYKITKKHFVDGRLILKWEADEMSRGVQIAEISIKKN